MRIGWPHSFPCLPPCLLQSSGPIGSRIGWTRPTAHEFSGGRLTAELLEGLAMRRFRSTTDFADQIDAKAAPEWVTVSTSACGRVGMEPASFAARSRLVAANLRVSSSSVP
jgi:hypothetical protein